MLASPILKGDDPVFADTRSDKATIHLPGSVESGNLQCNRGEHLVPVLHK